MNSEAWNRFWSKVDATGDCWEWAAGRIPQGYGEFSFKGRNHVAHRFAWELLVGEIPDGLVIDHLCRNRACVKPDHLEPVTQAENVRRSSWRARCKNGHPLIKYSKRRRCLICQHAHRSTAND